MSELKPTAWTWEYNGTQVTADKSLAMSLKADGVSVTPLYAIPEGYELVPVATIEKAFRDGFMESGEGYNGELYCDGWEGVINEFKNAAAEYKAMIADAQFPKGSVVDEEV